MIYIVQALTPRLKSYCSCLILDKMIYISGYICGKPFFDSHSTTRYTEYECEDMFIQCFDS